MRSLDEEEKVDASVHFQSCFRFFIFLATQINTGITIFSNVTDSVAPTGLGPLLPVDHMVLREGKEATCRKEFN